MGILQNFFQRFPRYCLGFFSQSYFTQTNSIGIASMTYPGISTGYFSDVVAEFLLECSGGFSPFLSERISCRVSSGIMPGLSTIAPPIITPEVAHEFSAGVTSGICFPVLLPESLTGCSSFSSFNFIARFLSEKSLELLLKDSFKSCFRDVS